MLTDTLLKLLHYHTPTLQHTQTLQFSLNGLLFLSIIASVRQLFPPWWHKRLQREITVIKPEITHPSYAAAFLPSFYSSVLIPAVWHLRPTLLSRLSHSLVCDPARGLITPKKRKTKSGKRCLPVPLHAHRVAAVVLFSFSRLFGWFLNVFFC